MSVSMIGAIRGSVVVGVAVAALVTAGAAPALAKQTKVGLCHWDATVGVLTPLNVPERVATKHLAKHTEDVLVGAGVDENCEPVGPAILALAYTEVDQVAGFTAGDVMIAQLEDVDGSGTPNAGDVIRTDRYPTDVIASGFASFQITEHEITNVNSVIHTTDGITVSVDTTTGSNQSFSWLQAVITQELYLESNSLGFTAIIDLKDFGSDLIAAILGSPSDPAVLVNNSPGVTGLGDNDFINVVVTPPTP